MDGEFERFHLILGATREENRQLSGILRYAIDQRKARVLFRLTNCTSAAEKREET